MEDENNISNFISATLNANGYSSDIAKNGKQAEVINELTALFEEVVDEFSNKEDSLEQKFQKVFSEEKLKEYVGHTPIQVIAGCILGLLIGWILH